MTEPFIEALGRAAPREVRIISQVLSEAGEKAWIVGGCVRDVLFDLEANQEREAADWDLATTARPEKTKKLFKRVIPTGIEHGTVTIVLSKQHFEITTLRGERGHSDGRRPDEVFFVDDLEEDLARRDFTVNAMAFDLESSTFHDPFRGEQDLKDRVLRAVGEPQTRFEEDGLRVLRCARFSATLGFDIEPNTASAIRPSLDSFKKVAQERVRDEWFKALRAKSPSRFFFACKEHGLLEVTAPFLFETANETVMSIEDAMVRVDACDNDPILRLALVIAAGAKKKSSIEEQRTASRSDAASLGKKLRLSREELSRLTLLCENYLFPKLWTENPAPANARRFLSAVGRESCAPIVALQRSMGLNDDAGAERFRKMLEEEADSEHPLSLKELAVTGKDLLAQGVPKGPDLGNTLRQLLDLVLEAPEKNRREVLLESLATLR